MKSFLRGVRSGVLLAFLFGLSVPGAFGYSTAVIDAGHGGHDRGGIPGQKTSEKAMALDVALRVRSYLRAAGLRTVMTRSRDEFVALGKRVAIANAERNAVFVSVHFNSARREGASGIETYYFSSRAAGLASAIHRKTILATGAEDRGVRRRSYYVLRKSRIPAVLFEGGFLTNRAEARRIESAAYRDKLAKSVAQAVISKRSL